MAKHQTREALAEQAILTVLEQEHDVHGFDDMPAGILTAFVAMWTLLLATLWIFFADDRGTAFALAICTGFVAIFFAVPKVMLRQIKHKLPRREGTFMTWTGPMTDRDAAIQVLLIPTALALTLVAMGLIKLAIF
jgi:hypothetical protein